MGTTDDARADDTSPQLPRPLEFEPAPTTPGVAPRDHAPLGRAASAPPQPTAPQRPMGAGGTVPSAARREISATPRQTNAARMSASPPQTQPAQRPKQQPLQPPSGGQMPPRVSSGGGTPRQATASAAPRNMGAVRHVPAPPSVPPSAQPRPRATLRNAPPPLTQRVESARQLPSRAWVQSRTSASRLMAALFDDRNPRVSAGLLYVIPFAPILLLLHERRNRFLRLHATQAIVLFGALAVEQIILYIAMVALGGWITDLALAAAIGIAFYVVGAACGLFGLVIWLRLLADAMAGRVRTYPYLTTAATSLERWVRNAQHWQRAQRWGHSSARDAVRST